MGGLQAPENHDLDLELKIMFLIGSHLIKFMIYNWKTSDHSYFYMIHNSTKLILTISSDLKHAARDHLFSFAFFILI